MHSLGIVQWNFTKRDHPGNPGRVSGLGPVNYSIKKFIINYFNTKIKLRYIKNKICINTK